MIGPRAGPKWQGLQAFLYKIVSSQASRYVWHEGGRTFLCSPKPVAGLAASSSSLKRLRPVSTPSAYCWVANISEAREARRSRVEGSAPQLSGSESCCDNGTHQGALNQRLDVAASVGPRGGRADTLMSASALRDGRPTRRGKRRLNCSPQLQQDARDGEKMQDLQCRRWSDVTSDRAL